MSADFRASQIQTGKVIVTSSLGNLAVYGIDTPGAAGNLGNIADSTLIGQLNQKDTFIFISGSKDSRGTNTKGTAVFGGDVYISGSVNGGTTTVRQGMIYEPTVVSSAVFGVQNYHYILGVSSSASSITLLMPAYPANGQTFLVKDVTGNARTYNINIDGNGRPIDGKNIYNLAVNYQSIQIINFGTYWAVI